MAGNVKLSVLMVEDNDDHIELCREHLHPDEFDFFVARSGAECIDAVKSRPYDVILLDYMLPDTTGMDLLPKIREYQVKALILFVSANDDADLSFAALKAGASDYMVKGFGYFRNLRDRIYDALEG